MQTNPKPDGYISERSPVEPALLDPVPRGLHTFPAANTFFGNTYVPIDIRMALSQSGNSRDGAKGRITAFPP